MKNGTKTKIYKWNVAESNVMKKHVFITSHCEQRDSGLRWGGTDALITATLHFTSMDEKFACLGHISFSSSEGEDGIMS